MGRRIISASQIGDFTTCPRKWWFKRLPKLPEPPKSYFTFGTVLHECVERFLLSTENGRVPANPPEVFRGQLEGNPTDLFPEGWETVKERDGSEASLTPNEAKQVRKVVTEAIENGTIVWEPNLGIERKVDIKVIDGVWLTGFVDIFRPGELGKHGIPEIHDHKTYGKGSVRYLKQSKTTSPNYVGADQQLLTYAVVTSLIDGYEGPVIVRHNQYPKFAGRKVRFMDSEPIGWDELLKHWEWIQKEAAEIKKVAKIERWEDVPGPRVDDACQKYGGCPFAGICTRQESIDVYRERVEREKNAADGRPRLNLRLEAPRKRRSNGGNTMPKDIFAKARAARSTKSAAQEAAAQTDDNPVTEKASKPKATKPKTQSKPKAAAPAAGHAAPWASESCKACKGSGCNKAGNACPICKATAKNRGVPSPDQYVVEATEEGYIAVAKEDAVEALQALGAPLEWSSSDGAGEGAQAAQEPEEAQEDDDPEEAAEEAQEDAQEPEDEPEEPEGDDEPEEGGDDEEEPEDEPEEEPEPERKPKATRRKASGSKAGRGRPKLGLTLLVGCTVARGPRRDTFSSSEILARFGGELAEAMGAESYWGLDTWKRRERLAEKADYIVGELAKCVVYHPGELGNDDVGSLIRVLMSCEEGIELVVIG